MQDFVIEIQTILHQVYNLIFLKQNQLQISFEVSFRNFAKLRS